MPRRGDRRNRLATDDGCSLGDERVDGFETGSDPVAAADGERCPVNNPPHKRCDSRFGSDHNRTDRRDNVNTAVARCEFSGWRLEAARDRVRWRQRPLPPCRVPRWPTGRRCASVTESRADGKSENRGGCAGCSSDRVHTSSLYPDRHVDAFGAAMVKSLSGPCPVNIQPRLRVGAATGSAVSIGLKRHATVG